MDTSMDEQRGEQPADIQHPTTNKTRPRTHLQHMALSYLMLRKWSAWDSLRVSSLMEQARACGPTPPASSSSASMASVSRGMRFV